MAGADLVTVCRAVLAPGSNAYIAELGVSPKEIETLPLVARMLMSHEDALVVALSNVDLARFIGPFAKRLTEPDQYRALDALLSVADNYAMDHAATSQYSLWSSLVLPRLASLAAHEPEDISQSGRDALLAAHKAYEARSALIGEILGATDWEIVAGSKPGNDDLDLLAVLVERRYFMQFLLRVSLSLDADEQTAFLRWASHIAGSNLYFSRPRSAG